MNIPIYTVIFEDKTIFTGGVDYFTTKWLEIPNKKIKHMFYTLPTHDQLLLAGYEQYYHIVEAIKVINKPSNNVPTILYTYILGKVGNKINSYRMKHSTGDISRKLFDINDEWIVKLNPIGWTRRMTNVKR